MGIAGAVEVNPGAVDPMVWLVGGIAAVTILTMLVLRAAARRKEDSDPLTSLFDRSNFDDSMDKAASIASKVEAQIARRTSVLTGRLDHMPHLRHVWGQETRNDAIEKVAQVMRAGVRKTDTFASGSDEEFTIIADGASESEASDIAKRLRDRLGAMPVPGMNDQMRLTASFGVAERRDGESDSELHARASAALNRSKAGAHGAGEDCIVTASDWEEVLCLPAPAGEAEGTTEAA